MLANALSANHPPCRADLGLGANRIGDDGAIELAYAIEHGTGFAQLHGLSLADNSEISDAGAVALAQALGASGRLRELFIHGMSFQQAGCEALVSALPKLTDLRRCVIGRVSPASIHRIESVQQQMRRTLHRDDIIICSWPLSEGPSRRIKKDRTARNRMPSALSQRQAVRDFFAP